MKDADLAGTPLARLPDALEVLAARMHEAVVARRRARPGSDQYQRASERIAQLNQLYQRLQRHMEIPAEIWQLEGSRRAAHGRG